MFFFYLFSLINKIIEIWIVCFQVFRIFLSSKVLLWSGHELRITWFGLCICIVRLFKALQSLIVSVSDIFSCVKLVSNQYLLLTLWDSWGVLVLYRIVNAEDVWGLNYFREECGLLKERCKVGLFCVLDLISGRLPWLVPIDGALTLPRAWSSWNDVLVDSGFLSRLRNFWKAFTAIKSFWQFRFCKWF